MNAWRVAPFTADAHLFGVWWLGYVEALCGLWRVHEDDIGDWREAIGEPRCQHCRAAVQTVKDFEDRSA